MKGKHFVRILIGVIDFYFSALVFWKFSRVGSMFEDYRYLLSLSAVWMVLGFLTGKLNFDRYMKVAYAEAAIVYLDIFAYVGIYFLTRINGFGMQGPDISIWGLPVMVAVELLLFFLYVSFMVHKLPTYYEEEIIPDECIDKSIERGAKLYKAPALADRTQPQQATALPGLLKLYDMSCRMPWPELRQWMAEHRNEIEDFALVLPNNDANAMQLSGPIGYQAVICMDRINNARQLNHLLENVNSVLPDGGYILCHAVTSSARRERIARSCPALIDKVVSGLDFLWSRVIPKLSLTRPFYFAVTDGQNRNLPRVEILGRLCRAGFEIASESQQYGEYYVIGTKVSRPHNEQKPNYGPIIKLSRKGKNGQTINVFKMRSMYAYSEYIQAYAYNILGLQKGGKLKDDFRVTPYGRFIRRCWIDELPMIVNLLRGDLKLVGVRPLSRHYFNLYTPEMQALRITVKPGLIPPFYAEKVRPVTIEDVQESERRYIEAYNKAPFRTDMSYLWKAFVNIVFRHSRSH